MRNILNEFKRDIGSVYSLLDFDVFIIDLPLSEIRDLKTYAEKQSLPVVIQKADKLEKILTGIRTHGSTKLTYETIYNQCIVLLVSYFSATLENLFEYCIESSLKAGASDALLSEEIKLHVKDMYSIGENPLAQVGEFLISGNKISFQDMKSIKRAFEMYLNISMEKDALTNDIIFAQAARHIIVHNGSEINSKFQHQITSATPRTIKPEMPNTGKLLFSKEEVIQVGKRMEEYIGFLSEKLSSFQRK